MKTIIEGMQVTNVAITKTCRANRTTKGAFHEAVEIIRKRYLETADLDVNKGATFNLTLTLNRDGK